MKLSSLPSSQLLGFLVAIEGSTSTLQSFIAETMASGAIGDFAMFPRLPIGLCLKIWKLALPGPRIVEV
jgi:hypothetical protein